MLNVLPNASRWLRALLLFALVAAMTASLIMGRAGLRACAGTPAPLVSTHAGTPAPLVSWVARASAPVQGRAQARAGDHGASRRFADFAPLSGPDPGWLKWVEDPVGPPPRADVTLLPRQGWGRPTADHFTLLADGRLTHVNDLDMFIHGVRNHPEMRRPPTFTLDAPASGRFVVDVAEVSGAGGTLVIRVDGRTVLTRALPGGSGAAAFEAPFPAGRHNIQVDNSGPDWIRVKDFQITDIRSSAVFASRAGRLLALWFGQDGKPLAAPPDANLAGLQAPFVRLTPGVYLEQELRAEVPPGAYLCGITGPGGFEQDLTLSVPGPRWTLDHAALPAGRPVDLLLATAGEGTILPGTVVVSMDGRRLPSSAVTASGSSADNSSIVIHLGPISPGGHRMDVKGAAGPGDAGLPSRAIRAVFPLYAGGGDATLPLVSLDQEGRFRAGGRIIYPLGFGAIHLFQPGVMYPTLAGGWVGSAWMNASESSISDWLATLAACGVNVVRIGLDVPGDGIQGDLGGKPNPKMIAALRRFLSIASRYGVRVLPALWWWHYSVNSFSGLPPYDRYFHSFIDGLTNPGMIALQASYARQVVTAFRGDGRIFAWEVMNEVIPEWQGSSDVPIQWTHTIAAAIRAADPTHLITISPNTNDSKVFLAFGAGAGVDFLNAHIYADGHADCLDFAIDEMRQNRRAKVPVILGEAGYGGGGANGISGIINPVDRALGTRDILWASALEGGSGAIVWDGNTADPRELAAFFRILKTAPELFTDPRTTGPGRLKIGPGYQGVVRASHSGLVIYLANTTHRDGSGCRAPGPASLDLQLPFHGTGVLYDLSTGQPIRTIKAAGTIRLHVPPSRDDYALTLARG